MCALYAHPDHAYGHISVSDPDPAVDEPPAPGDGEVCSIDMEHVYTCSDRHWNRCQLCPKSVCKAYPHIIAFVYLENEGLNGRFTRVYFCSRECLGQWAGRAEVDNHHIENAKRGA